MRVKRWWAGLAVCVLVFGAIGVKKITNYYKIETYPMERVNTVSVGRGSIGVFDQYAIRAYGASYDNVLMVSNAAMSEPSFNAWVDNRWKEIEKEDAKQSPEHLPTINRVSPHAVWFKFNFLEIVGQDANKKSAYKGEGIIWMDNKAIFLAPSGQFKADTKIPKMMGRLRERLPEHKDTGLCADFYCLEMPPAKSERVSVNISFPGIEGLTLFVQIESYDTQQKESRLQGGTTYEIPVEMVPELPVTTEYSALEKGNAGSLLGEQNISGGTEKTRSGVYTTSIGASWYYAGTSGNPNDPSVKIDLLYGYDTKHKPSKMGWFDNETVKKTGFTPEKFMSMWEATLKSFKRNR